MTNSKEIEAKLLEVYHQYWDSYIDGNWKTTISLLHENFKLIGSTAEEIINNKEEAILFFKNSANEICGNVQMRNRKFEIIAIFPEAIINEFFDLYIKNNEDWSYHSKTRFTSILQETNEGWKFVLQHGSVPDAKVREGETLVFNQISKENQELRDAIRRRTAELELKNKELEIEAALEKVRNVALSLKKSDELLDVAEILYHQLFLLGFTTIRNVIIDIHTDTTGGFLDYDYSPEMGKSITAMSYNNHPILEKQVQEIHASTDGFFEIILEGEDLQELIDLRIKNGEEPDLRLNNAKQLTYNLYSFGKGEIGISTFGVLAKEQKLLLKRFRNVFSFAYNRYSELIEAEKREYEARIEASLEKVRSVALGLTKSEQMIEVAQVLYEQLLALGFTNIRNAIIDINNDDGKTFTDYDYSHDMQGAITKISKDADATIREQIQQTEASNDAFFQVVIEGDDLQELIATRKMLGEKEDPRLIGIDQLTYNLYSFGNGSIGISNFGVLDKKQKKLLKQFRNVFTFAYTRYTDLIASEKSARETQIDIALERVRSRTMAMQNSSELAETSVVVFQQLLNLGIAPNRLFIGIIKEKTGEIEAWATNEDGSKIGNHFTLNIKKNASVKKMYDGWKQKKKTITLEMQGDELQQYFHYLSNEMKIPFKGGLLQKRRVQSIAYFGQGLIGMASTEIQPIETTHLLERFAAVFNLTYTRFNDLKIVEAHAVQAEEDLIKLQTEKKRAEDALLELQTTQKQLIQSEKMASLGELTAGIAHEIQNPLNFVNNFSEVSTELLLEMKEELALGNYTTAEEIIADLVQNLEKINHHGKRADGIVKGMLQHSSRNSSSKEPSNLNQLCDEFVRLSYHGLRAKDKSFNATINTSFDKNIGIIPLIPQDFSRVVLNLLNNAFYAVSEKSKTSSTSYIPVVSITTLREKDTVKISVSDNGNGMSKEIKEKIFQPFFTTKPTGKGTGLGLSISYDIITKGHNGELTVDSTPNEGSIFTIIIPISI